MTGDDINEEKSAKPATTIPIIILNGFLGSGKTTLLKSLLIQSHKKQLSVGIVVNDMSELDVDGLIVAQTEFFDKQDSRFQSIHSCVLSSEKGIEKLRLALDKILADSPPD